MSDKRFPIYNNNRRIGERGVTLVKSIVEDQFNWIFRNTHLEDDFGLDGYFDIIGTDNSVTGKYLGVQIKTGESYFINEGNFGWKYTGEIKHLNYFLNSNFPILIILVNLNTREAFWVEFNKDKTEKITNGWSLIVPKANILNLSAKKLIANLAGEVIDYMAQIEYQWEINKKIKESSLILLNVSRDAIETRNVQGVIDLLTRLTINDDMIQKSRGKFLFLVDGYDDDDREIYEIEEIREWTKVVIPAFKYWAYFLNMDPFLQNYAGIKFLLFCSIDVKVIGPGEKGKLIEFKGEHILPLLRILYHWLNEFTDMYSISDEINIEQSNLMKSIFTGIIK